MDSETNNSAASEDINNEPNAAESASKLSRSNSFSERVSDAFNGMVDAASEFLEEHKVFIGIAVGVGAAIASAPLSGPGAIAVGVAASLAFEGVSAAAEKRVEEKKKRNEEKEGEEDEHKEANQSKGLSHSKAAEVMKPNIEFHNHHAKDHPSQKGSGGKESFAKAVGHKGHDPKKQFAQEVLEHAKAHSGQDIAPAA